MVSREAWGSPSSSCWAARQRVAAQATQGSASPVSSGHCSSLARRKRLTRLNGPSPSKEAGSRERTWVGM